MIKRLILTIVALFFMVGTAMSMDVCLEWDAHTDPDVVGYKVFVRAESAPEYNYDSPAWAGPETECSVPLADGVTWYLVARAVDSTDLESGDSNELSWFNDFPWVEDPPSTMTIRLVPCGP